MDRRRFLHAGLGSLFAASGLTVLLPPPVGAAERFFNLRAQSAVQPLPDGADLPVWRFSQTLPGPGALGAGIVAHEGDRLTVTLSNDLDRPLRWVIPGVLEETPVVQAGDAAQFTFTAPQAGGYFFTDGLDQELARAMGLAAPLVVLPADGGARIGPPDSLFDRQYTLFLQEADSRLNQAMAAGQTFDLGDYAPDYFFVNGLAYPATRDDPDTLIRTAVGERVALRFVNAGLIHYPMHVHGYHCRVIQRNRQPETTVVQKDTVPVAPGEAVEVILPVHQAGTYPLHSHYVPAVTGGGVYPLGGLMYIEAA